MRCAMNDSEQDPHSKLLHDLRKHLAVVKGGVDLIIEELVGPTTEQQKDVLMRMRNNLNSLASLINTLQPPKPPDNKTP